MFWMVLLIWLVGAVLTQVVLRCGTIFFEYWDDSDQVFNIIIIMFWPVSLLIIVSGLVLRELFFVINYCATFIINRFVQTRKHTD